MENQMTFLGLSLMITAWTIVTVLMVYSVYKVLKGKKIEN